VTVGCYTCDETPHSGYHLQPSRKGRFFEGWYFKVAVGEGQGNREGSFAFIYSVEDPNCPQPKSGVGVQIMGPDDSYTIQYTRDTRNFWATRSKLGAGCSFRLKQPSGRYPTGMLDEGKFNEIVEDGFQVSSDWNQGHLTLNAEGTGGVIEPGVKECSWAYRTRRVHGWGNSGKKQVSTAGWLAALPVFEPHWQILMSYGLSSGWIRWGKDLYEFKDAPSYAEKNWGEGFPLRWFWIQCNTFGGDGYTAITAGGGRRSLPFSVVGDTEDVALIGIHHKGRFIEVVPWNGEVTWSISPWGKWRMSGKSGNLAVELNATTDSLGTLLRAPTTAEGLTTKCRDTFDGHVSLKVWEDGKLFLDLTSETAALEVGGGPWWGPWESKAIMKEPLRTLLRVAT